MSVRRNLGTRQYKAYTDENLKAALTLVSSGEMSLRDINAMYNILNHIPNSNSNTMFDSWLRTFEGFLEQQRRKETTVKTKKRRLTVPPGQSIAHPNINSDDEDDPVINVVLTDHDEISVNENLIEPIPKTSRSNQNNISHDVENNLLNKPEHFNIGDFILVKYLYNAETKKEHFKFFLVSLKKNHLTVFMNVNL